MLSPRPQITPLQAAIIGLVIFAVLYALAVAAMLQFQLRCGAFCGNDAILFILKGFGR